MMIILNDEGWQPTAYQLPLNRFTLMVGLLLGAMLEMMAFGPIAHAAEAQFAPSGPAAPNATTLNNAGLESAPLARETAAGAATDPSQGSDSTPTAAARASRSAAIATGIDQRPQKGAKATASARPSTRFAGPFTAPAATEAVMPSAAAIAPPLPRSSTPIATATRPSASHPEERQTAVLAQVPPAADAVPPPAASPIAAYQPLLQFQAATTLQDGELSGRLRTTALYALNEQVLLGATVDVVGGNAFVDSADEGLSINELYIAAAPFHNEPNLRFVGGLIDLTAYLDRNSFAKDGVTHFFHPVFQTNPSLSAAGIGSRPGLLMNWSATDQIELKAVAFSSSRDIGDWALDGFAAEAGFRTGNFIVRGTFATARDAGDDTGFTEIFQIQRGDDRVGLREDDREVAYGINAEYFIDALNLGLFGRYGWYENQEIGRGGVTFSFGANVLDVLLAGDRLGLGYGQQLSNRDLQTGKTPDVWEVFYDAPVYSQVRVGVSLQSRDEFSDTGLGLRVRADW